MADKKIHIVGGGTVMHVRPHLALSAVAYGGTARRMKTMYEMSRNCGEHQLDTELHLTRMAGGDAGETNADVANLIERLTADPATKIVVLNAALCDFHGMIGHDQAAHGKLGTRLQSRIEGGYHMTLRPTSKLAHHIRRQRKDIFAVAFKTTCGVTEDEQYLAGLRLLKESSLNLVLANDIKTKMNMVITPEEARYHVTDNRDAALWGLVDMSLLRSHLTFTRSTVIAGAPVPWHAASIPQTLRKVVQHCIHQGAYKPFNGATVGHFACKIDDTTFLTSIRKSDFNDLHKTGMVLIKTDGPDSVIAYGAKPSVGGQSQRIVFHDHQDYDCIVHFHCPKKPGSLVPEVSQREYECGSHECGRNTSKGLQRFGNLSAVYLQEHGPNIVFHRSIDPMEVINFIDANFELGEKTGGYVSLGEILKRPDTLETLQDLTNPQNTP